MIYISSRKMHGKELTHEYVNKYLSQFSDEKKIEITGIVVFTGDLIKIADRLASGEQRCKSHVEPTLRATSLIKHFANMHLDSMTELYAVASDQIESTGLPVTEIFIAGYRNALLYITETASRALESNVIKDEDKAIAKQLYMSIGQELSDKLKNMMENEDMVQEYMGTDDTSPLSHFV